MSSGEHEPTIVDRLGERPHFKPKEVAGVKPRALVYRFLAGALTSVVAGVISLVFGARAGGIFLAFPAILAASLTLIAEQDDRVEAREDARGATVGGLALATFAAVAALTLGQVSAVVALAAAALAWLLVAFVGYFALWGR